ncbi:unnamed protein product [Pleuronectes platessa]|uniref:Uncharacterized protein n=1 Tax=Pleuronectes platessa TaxID=8262 RepID=A0A9N7UTG3_PLEPL|nr:unnamed protein product [Pleuronectes platessa]
MSYHIDCEPKSKTGFIAQGDAAEELKSRPLLQGLGGRATQFENHCSIQWIPRSPTCLFHLGDPEVNRPPRPLTFPLLTQHQAGAPAVVGGANLPWPWRKHK